MPFYHPYGGGAFIKIPVPVVPFTLSSFFYHNDEGLLLGKRLGALSVAVYVRLDFQACPFCRGGLGYLSDPLRLSDRFCAGAWVTGTDCRGREGRKPGFGRLLARKLLQACLWCICYSAWCITMRSVVCNRFLDRNPGRCFSTVFCWLYRGCPVPWGRLSADRIPVLDLEVKEREARQQPV